MAQLMYYHQCPPQTVPTEVDVGYIVSNRYFTGQLSLMGGPYQWDEMSDSPGDGASNAQRQAIGKLCYDAGVSVGTCYGKNGSGSRTARTAKALTETFNYRSAVSGLFDLDNVNPNLLDGYPVLITIGNDDRAHAVIIDGYGIQNGEQYHHLNMGWKGSGNTWYALPKVKSYDVIDECVYNIYPCSAIDLVWDLIETVKESDFHQRGKNSLSPKLVSAVKVLEDINENNDGADINNIEAFINEVEAQRGKKITSVQADELIWRAEAIIHLLSSLEW
jgi:hypothetical protein